MPLNKKAKRNGNFMIIFLFLSKLNINLQSYNFWHRGGVYNDILMKNLYSFLNKSISIIQDRCYCVNLIGLLVV